jgi:hypothetical protein
VEEFLARAKHTPPALANIAEGRDSVGDEKTAPPRNIPDETAPLRPPPPEGPVADRQGRDPDKNVARVATDLTTPPTSSPLAYDDAFTSVRVH